MTSTVYTLCKQADRFLKQRGIDPMTGLRKRRKRRPKPATPEQIAQRQQARERQIQAMNRSLDN